MVLPNLVALLALTSVVVATLNDFEDNFEGKSNSNKSA
jgi:Na+/alanine symporter